MRERKYSEKEKIDTHIKRKNWKENDSKQAGMTRFLLGCTVKILNKMSPD